MHFGLLFCIFHDNLEPNNSTYNQRINVLLKHNIALWDVLQNCYRTGSLDTAIKMNSVKANDFQLFFSEHTMLNKVYFNGGKAESMYMKIVLPKIKERYGYLKYIRLPSTSPAHAAMSFQQKLDIWTHSIKPDHV